MDMSVVDEVAVDLRHEARRKLSTEMLVWGRRNRDTLRARAQAFYDTPEGKKRQAISSFLSRTARQISSEHDVYSVCGEDGDYQMVDIDLVAEEIPDPVIGTYYTGATSVYIDAALDGMLARLMDREREIVELRYGLTGEDTYTLEQMARYMGITRERVRQIEVRAMGKMRYAAHSVGATITGLEVQGPPPEPPKYRPIKGGSNE